MPMMTTIRAATSLFLMALTLMALTMQVMAEPDIPALPYGASSMESEGPRQGIHVLPLGATRRAMGEWQLENQQQVEGQLWRRTWQLPRTTETRDFHQLMLDYWAKRGARLLFHCKERSCGSSNHWANQVFDVKQLYAPDDQQFYSALQWNDADAKHYIALYSVERANRRRYSHLLWIEAEPTRDALPVGVAMTELAGGGPVFIADGLTPEQKSVWLDGLQSLLAEQADWSLVIVGHHYGEGTLDALKRRSEDSAAEWQQALVEAGVPEARLRNFGVGPLAQQPGTPRNNGVVLFRLP